jgi:RHH-type proline utilization regulon transcriptional repressor/proline dehydrogenase/delta 1-pyrroline-5-carboxylate dehydrogenase
VLASAFRSAGQRCSALRLLALQEDVAPRMLAMIEGAARELAIGDPRDPATHVGPVIDAAALARLEAHVERMAAAGHGVTRCGTVPAKGFYMAPTIIMLERPEQLTEEVFGPVLHVVRWPAGGLERLLAAVAASGYGLTLGVHSRVEATAEAVVAATRTGNVYVNRNMIGATVETQPFGGFGLSGTGPKAGGPHYLRAFTTEQVVTVNTAAAGGNASLLALEED